MSTLPLTAQFPISTVVLFQPHPHFYFFITPPPALILVLPFFDFISVLISTTHSSNEAERDVGRTEEKDIPGHHCHQLCKSSAVPWGPPELVSD